MDEENVLPESDISIDAPDTSNTPDTPDTLNTSDTPLHDLSVIQNDLDSLKDLILDANEQPSDLSALLFSIDSGVSYILFSLVFFSAFFLIGFFFLVKGAAKN